MEKKEEKKVMEVVNEKKETKKVERKRVKEVEYEKVIGKKGVFKVMHKGDLILWCAKSSGDYLVYVVNEGKRELGLRLVRQMLQNKQVTVEEAEARKKQNEEKGASEEQGGTPEDPTQKVVE